MTLLIIFCFAVTMGVCLPGYINNKTGRWAMLLKWLGTAMGALMGVIGALQQGGAAWLCAAGLIVCAAADVVLERKFLPGMACFAAGHACYIAWFLSRTPVGAGHGIAFAALAAVALFTIHKWTGLFCKAAIPLLAYALFLCAMGACGAAGMMNGIAGALTAAGAVLFVASDMMVYRGLLKPWGKTMDFVAMGTYYTAQLLLGCATLLGA